MRTVAEWNTLDNEAVHAESVDAFKAHLKKNKKKAFSGYPEFKTWGQLAVPKLSFGDGVKVNTEAWILAYDSEYIDVC